MPRSVYFAACLLLALCCIFIRPAKASDDQVWWATAVSEAERDGYKLIDTSGLVDLLAARPDALVLDVRADYEYEAGHIPGADNLEFDLGDRMSVPDAKRQAFEQLVGADKKRLLVIYCRSFR